MNSDYVEKLPAINFNQADPSSAMSLNSKSDSKLPDYHSAESIGQVHKRKKKKKKRMVANNDETLMQQEASLNYDI